MSNIEHLFICLLAIYRSSLGKRLLMSSAHNFYQRYFQGSCVEWLTLCASSALPDNVLQWPGDECSSTALDRGTWAHWWQTGLKSLLEFALHGERSHKRSLARYFCTVSLSMGHICWIRDFFIAHISNTLYIYIYTCIYIVYML